MNDPIAEIGSRRELLVDDFLVNRLSGGARQQLHAPTAREPSLRKDAPWEGCLGAYETLITDAGRHRLYYVGWQIDLDKFHGGEFSHPVTICLAESDDGIHWERVPVGIYEFEGNRDNNIVWMGTGDDGWGLHGFSPFLDSNPACRPAERYKAVGAGWNITKTGLYLMTSPDGVRWTLASEKPFLAGYALDSQNTVLWSPTEGCYRAYLRHWEEGLFKGRRTVFTATSPDLKQWSEAVPLQFPGSTPVELYTNNVLPYYRAPHLRVGFPARYVERPWSPAIEALPEVDHRRRRARMSPRYGSAVSDTGFMTSRDAITFHRWDEAFIRPGLRARGSWAYGDIYAAWGMVETESDLPGGGPELSFYVGEGYWRNDLGLIRRYSLRLDGFVSVNAPLAGGGLLTKPLVFDGERLSLNISTSAAGSARVELQDAGGHPVPGYALEDCWEIIGDTTDYTVRWKAGTSVGALAGRPVRLRVQLHDADLYSLQFAPGSSP